MPMSFCARTNERFLDWSEGVGGCPWSGCEPFSWTSSRARRWWLAVMRTLSGVTLRREASERGRRRVLAVQLPKKKTWLLQRSWEERACWSWRRRFRRLLQRQKPVESGSYHTVETGGRDGEPGRKASRKVPEPPGLQSGGPAVTAGESLTESPSSCQSFDGTDG